MGINPWEIVGFTASILVLISMSLTSEWKLRIVNTAGCVAYVIYGLARNLPSIWIINGIVCIINIWKLIRKKKGDSTR